MDLELIEIERILRDEISPADKLLENQELFAMRFVTWALCDSDAQAMKAANCTPYALLQRYKSRPYINQNTSLQ